MERAVPLTTAAMRLGVGYAQARDLLLRGELRGVKDERGRYVVDGKDLDRLVREREKARAVPA